MDSSAILTIIVTYDTTVCVKFNLRLMFYLLKILMHGLKKPKSMGLII